jgi:hypothetical protein
LADVQKQLRALALVCLALAAPRTEAGGLQVDAGSQDAGASADASIQIRAAAADAGAPDAGAPDASVPPRAEPPAESTGSPLLAQAPGAVDALRERLQALKAARGSEPLRVVQIGDSHTEAGFFSRELSRLLAAGRPVSPGFLWPGMLAPGEVEVVQLGRRRDWREESWLEPQGQGPFGPRGVAFAAVRPGAVMELRANAPLPPGTRLTVFYAATPGHRPAELRAGTRGLARFTPPRAPPESRFSQVEVTWPARATALQLAIGGTPEPGEFRLYGFAVDRPDAVLRYDALGVRGTTSDHPVKRDDGALAEFLRLRPPDVLVVWFGTNSAVARPFPADLFRQSFSTLLEKLRAVAPDAALVVVGPPDLQKRPEGCGAWAFKKRRRLYPHEREALKRFACTPETSVVRRPGKPPRYAAEGVTTEAQWQEWLSQCAFATLPSIEQVTETERALAVAAGGMFFDTYAFMGGAGAMHRWVCETPELGAFDHVHLTPEGHARLAGAVWDAIRTGSR